MPAIEKDASHIRGRISHPLDDGEIDLDVSMVRGRLGNAITLQLSPRLGNVPRFEDLGFATAQIGQVSAMLEQPAGCLLVSGPRRSGGTTTLGSLISAKGTEGRRVVVIETTPSAPIPGSLSLCLEAGAARRCWQDVAVAQCADVVVLDGVLNGSEIEDVLSPAASGRFILVRTDWLDTRDLLEFLFHVAPSRGPLSRRLLGVIQQRLVRLTDSEKAADNEGLPLWQQGVFEVLALDEETRQVIRDGESLSRVFARAARGGFTSLAEECRRLVQNESLSAAEAARVLT
jgi:type II secretory ATPase GspE/PulE/Tfp pilus assembly ATPase PilB-like protein